MPRYFDDEAEVSGSGSDGGSDDDFSDEGDVSDLIDNSLRPARVGERKKTKKRKKKIDTKKMSDTLIKMINREPVSEDEVEEVVQVAEPKEVPQSRQGRKTEN